MNEIINTVFLNTIKVYIQNNKELLPIDPGKFYRDYMKKVAKQLNVVLDFKHSTYKKINNYLKHLAKDKNLIEFNKIKNTQNDFIQKIYWSHPIIEDFKPTIKEILVEETKVVEKKILLDKDEQFEVHQWFKPNTKIKMFFEAMNPNFKTDEYYTLKDCNDILTKFLKTKDLFIKGTSDVKLTEPFWNASKDDTINIQIKET